MNENIQDQLDSLFPKKDSISPTQKRYQELDAYYGKKLNDLVHEHFQKITSETTQEQIEEILKGGNKKWLDICARARVTDKKYITLNINAFTNFLKDAMNSK